MKHTIIPVLTLSSVTILSGFILSRLPSKSNSNAATASTSATASVTVSESCTLSSETGTTDNPAHSATLNPTSAGHYVSEIGLTNISITCNDTNGWALYAIGDGDGTTKTDLVNTADSTKVISTGTTTTGDTSSWAMKLLSGTGTNLDGTTGPILTNYATYTAIPSTNTKVASLNRSSYASTSASLKTTYAVYSAPTQTAGTYTGKVKYTLTHPYTNVVCDDGYENINGVCTEIHYMQDVATWGSTLLANTGDSIQAVDSRDGKHYWVTRLADGNIWMTQNLDLDLSSSTTLTSADTDVTSDWTPATTYATGSTTRNYSYDTAESYDPGDVYFVTSGSTSDDISYSSLSACIAAGNSTEVCQHGHSGNYYNWYAATAGSNATTMSSGDEAPSSICPKGWRLPYGTTANKSWYYLLNNSISGYGANAASSQAMRTAPFYISRAGDRDANSMRSVGSLGSYWSSTAYGYHYTYYLVYVLYFSSVGDGSLQGGENARTNKTMRCVARSTISDISTMQEFGSLSDADKTSVLDSMTTGTTYSLTDTRDNETYYVAKLADGKVWMLDNLRLGGNSAITLTSSDSNISSSYTLPASGNANFDSSSGNTASAINTDTKNFTTTSYGSGSGKIGVYYNYCAASAGTICTDSNSGDASYDICPKGWRLPTGGSSGEFQALYVAYGSDATNFRAALSTPLSGYFESRPPEGWGVWGLFWSSTHSDSTSMYQLLVDDFVYVTTSSDRRYGLSVRCVLR